MILTHYKEKGKKIESEKEKAVLLCLHDEDRKSIREIAKQTKNYGNEVSKTGVSKIIDKYMEFGIIKVRAESENKFSIDKGKIHIKSFDMEMLKQLMTPATLALFLICFPLAYASSINAIYMALGGVLVFIPQLVYSVYKILKMPQGKEIFVLIKEKVDPSKWQPLAKHEKPMS